MGYYDYLLEDSSSSTIEDNDSYSYSQKKKKSKGGYSKVTKVSVKGDGPLMKAYDRYVMRCQRRGKHPMSFSKWCALSAGAGIAGAGALAGGAVVGVKAYRKKHPKVTNEAFADGYYAALKDIDVLNEMYDDEYDY